MKKFAGLCLLIVSLLLVLFLSGSPLINLSYLNLSLFSNVAVVGSPFVQAAYTDTIHTLGGRESIDPLRVDVMNNGSLAIYTWQPVSPGSTTYVYENRYFDGFSWGSNLFLSDSIEQFHLYSDYFQDLPYVRYDYPFTSEDIGLGNQVVSGNSIVTTWFLLDGVCELTQAIIYVPGSSFVSKTFTITHTGSQAGALTDLRFMHGGDIYFGDEALCTFDAATQTMTVKNQDATIGGLIAMTPGPDSSLGSWYAGWIEDLFYETAGGNLPGTVVAYDEDIGAQLQWNRDTLAAGESWTITLVERFTEEASGTGETTESTTNSTTTETTVVTETTESSTTETNVVTETTESSTTETNVVTETTESSTTETTVTETTIEISQIVTSEQATTTTPSSDQAVPATGEDGSCQIMAGGMMFLVAALYWWFKRLHSCH